MQAELDAYQAEQQAQLEQLEYRWGESIDAIRLEWRNTKLEAGLSRAMEDLLASAQMDLDYSYLLLHPEFKEKVDSLIREILKLPSFQQLVEQCEKTTLELCSFHGNDEVDQAYRLENTHKVIYRSLGNEIMRFIQKHQEETLPISRGLYFQQKIIFPLQAEQNNGFLVDMATPESEGYYDPSSSRSLWGQLPGVEAPENIDDLWTARDAVDLAAKTYGIWRATIGVSSETAQRCDLNRRESWKALVTDKINVIADELGISQKDFCWVASWHGEGPGSPHVHVMYWDASNTVHPHIMTTEKFKAMKDHIQSAFEDGITSLMIQQPIKQEHQFIAQEPELEKEEEMEP